MTAPARYPAADQARRAMIAKVQIARKELRLDDGAYRAILLRLTGCASSADCTVAQLGLVLDELKAKGWAPTVFVSPGDNQKPARAVGIGRRPADTPVAKKARAMWISLHQLGAVRDPSERALEAFARRQLRVEAMQWADQALGYKLIEALKAMAEREGWSQDLTRIPGRFQVQTLKRNLIKALWKKLDGSHPYGVGKPLWQHMTEEEMDRQILRLAADLKAREGRA